MEKHNLYVIVGSTNTFMGQVIRRVTNSKYNHCSVVLDGIMYSFTRYYKHLWFTGCFCTESIDIFNNYTIFSISLSHNEYIQVLNFIDDLNNRFSVYNYIGALLVLLNIPFNRDYSYICSTFVSKILSFILEIKLGKNLGVYKPMDIFNLLRYSETDIVKELV